MNRAPLASVAATAALALLTACSGGSKAAPPTTATAGTSTTTTVVAAGVPAATAPTTTTVPRAQPEVPTDPTALGAQLVADEQALRDPATTSEAYTAAARRLQVMYRHLGGHPEWDSAVLPQVPAALADAVGKNIDARRHFFAMAADTPKHDTLPAWRIVAPAAADDLLAWYHEGEARYGVGWSYLAAVNLVETGLGQIEGLSTAGAQGPMQFLPSTWDAYGNGGDVHSPHDAIIGAAHYLAANGLADGNVDGALYRYNNSHDYAAAVEDYAAILAAEPDLFRAYHAWAIYYATVAGDVLLPVGYETSDPIPVADWLATHPQ